MIVISALVTKHGTAHASDSFITKVKRNGGIEVINSQQTKLVYVKHWRGVLAYWELAQFKQWSTLEWRRERARIAREFPNPEEFANTLAVDRVHPRLRSKSAGQGATLLEMAGFA
jgi:hypothetical protein